MKTSLPHLTLLQEMARADKNSPAALLRDPADMARRMAATGVKPTVRDMEIDLIYRFRETPKRFWPNPEAAAEARMSELFTN